MDNEIPGPYFFIDDLYDNAVEVLALRKLGLLKNKNYNNYFISQRLQKDNLVKGYDLDPNYKLVKVSGAKGRRLLVAKPGDYHRSVVAALNELGM